MRNYNYRKYIIGAMGSVAAGALFAIFAFQGSTLAFTGPTQPSGTGSGAVGADTSQNIGVNATPAADTKVLIKTGVGNLYGLRVMNSVNSPVLVVKEDGLEVAGHIVIPNSLGNYSIYTWQAGDTNWRIGMNSVPGFARALATTQVQYLTYAPGGGQGFAVGVNGGNSSFEILGFDHTAYFRGNVGIGAASPTAKLEVSGRIRAMDAATPALTSGKSIEIYYEQAGNTGVIISTDRAPNTLTPLVISGSPIDIRTSFLDGRIYLTGDNVGIGTVTPESSALLDLTSTAKGFLPPRMTTDQRNIIASPAAGLMIFNTTTGDLNYYNGGWVVVGSYAP